MLPFWYYILLFIFFELSCLFNIAIRHIMRNNAKKNTPMKSTSLREVLNTYHTNNAKNAEKKEQESLLMDNVGGEKWE